MYTKMFHLPTQNSFDEEPRTEHNTFTSALQDKK